MARPYNSLVEPQAPRGSSGSKCSSDVSCLRTADPAAVCQSSSQAMIVQDIAVLAAPCWLACVSCQAKRRPAAGPSRLDLF